MLRVFSTALFSFVLLGSACAQIAPSQTAPSQTAPTQPDKVPVQQKFVLRSGHVTMCQPGQGCTEEKIGGRKYLVMETDGFLLKVASGEDQKHGYADITITNETGSAQQLNPSSFRMEESEPKLHRLSYVDPNRQQAVAEREPKPAKAESSKGLPPPEYWTSEEHEEDKKVRKVVLVNPTVPVLRAGPIAPDATVSGRVYFERPRTSAGVTVFLALPGALFEFPCELVQPKVKKHHKNETAAGNPEAQS